MKNAHSQAGLSTLTRPIYSPGLLLEDGDLTTGIDYARNLSRLLFRSFFGCGVICGLAVEAKATCNRKKLAVTIACGVALDCLGDPIEVPKSVTITYDPECDPFPETLYVILCKDSIACQPRDSGCGCDGEGAPVKTRLREGYKASLETKEPKGLCQCTEVDEGDTQDCRCGCGCGCEGCVLLGTISLGQDTKILPSDDIAVDASGVRQIRPALAQYCPPKRVATKDGDESRPIAPAVADAAASNASPQAARGKPARQSAPKSADT